MPERSDEPPQWLWVPLLSALALIGPGALALATHRLFLFASLGPTAVTMAQQPRQPSARAYNAVVSHAAGLAAAFSMVFAFGLAHTPSIFMTGTVSPARFGASILAVAMAMLLEMVLKAQHPPAASTTLLASLGSFHPTWYDTGLVMGGVVAVTLVGEILRRIRLRFL
jgi:hypothetical protein